MGRGRLAVLALCALSGCGGGASRPAPPSLGVALDFTPNAVHAPIYAAVREGLDRRAGVRLAIHAPGASPDSLKALLAGSVDLAVLDIHDLGLAVAKGRDVVGVAALVQRPLAAILALPRIRRPCDLRGERVGVSGLPSDPAVLRAVLRHDGCRLSAVHQVTIGFAAVQSLLGRKVAAVPAFWNAEGVTLRRRGVEIREFRVEDYGAPPYPEVVLVARRSTLGRRRRDVAAAVRAIAAGVRAVRAHPDAAVADIARAGNAPDALVRAQLRAVSPIFGTGLHRAVLRRWAAWDARFGILPRRIEPDRAFALPAS